MVPVGCEREGGQVGWQAWCWDGWGVGLFQVSWISSCSAMLQVRMEGGFAPQLCTCMVALQSVSLSPLSRRCSEWVHVEGDFAGIMLVIMPCRSEKSQQGVAR